MLDILSCPESNIGPTLVYPKKSSKKSCQIKGSQKTGKCLLEIGLQIQYFIRALFYRPLKQNLQKVDYDLKLRSQEKCTLVLLNGMLGNIGVSKS